MTGGLITVVLKHMFDCICVYPRQVLHDCVQLHICNTGRPIYPTHVELYV